MLRTSSDRFSELMIMPFKPRTIAFLAPLALVAVVFGITLIWRLHLASEFPGARNEIVTAQAYYWLQNWVHEGAVRMRFMLPYLPLSIESPGIEYRDELYRSYPPGAQIPLYLLSLFYRNPPIEIISAYDLFCHAVLVAAVTCAGFIVMARAVRVVSPSNEARLLWAPALLAISAGLFMTVATGPSYFFTRIYNWDIGVLPWIGLALLLEAAYASNTEAPGKARMALGLQMVVFTIGLWTDWLMTITVFVWIALRLAARSFGVKEAVSAYRSAGLAAAVMAANFVLIFAWRILAALDQSSDSTVPAELYRTFYKLIYRAGLTTEDPITVQMFLSHLAIYLTTYFSVRVFHLVFFLFASALSIGMTFYLLRRIGLASFIWPVMSLAVLSTVPAVAYLCLLPQHAYFHDFSIVKFAMPLSLVVMALLPMTTAIFFAKVLEVDWRCPAWLAQGVLLIVTCGAALSDIYFSMSRYDAPQQHFPAIVGDIGRLGTVVARNTTYSDVVFSPQFAIGVGSYEVGFSRKLVHRSSDIDKDLPSVTEHICEPFNLVIVSDDVERPARATPPDEISRDSGLVFYRWRNLQPRPCPGKKA
jgi:hypothetical protein